MQPHHSYHASETNGAKLHSCLSMVSQSSIASSFGYIRGCALGRSPPNWYSLSAEQVLTGCLPPKVVRCKVWRRPIAANSQASGFSDGMMRELSCFFIERGVSDLNDVRTTEHWCGEAGVLQTLTIWQIHCTHSQTTTRTTSTLTQLLQVGTTTTLCSKVSDTLASNASNWVWD